MKPLIAWFADNPVAANLLMLFVLAAGLAGATQVRQETFPNVSFDTVRVGVAHPGASAEEIERAICVRVEEAIHGLPGVRRLVSSATEGFGATWVELESGTDAVRVVEEVRTRVAAIEGLPAEAEPPTVRELIDDSVLLAVGIFGSDDERLLRAVGERLRDELNLLPEVARAELQGARPYEVAIEVSEPDLQRYDVRFDDVTRAVRASSLDLAGGALDTRGGEILLRGRAQALHGPEFARIPLLLGEDGTRVQLGDVARVVDGFAETEERVRIDGEPAVVVRLLTSERENVLTVADAVGAHLERARAWLPPGVQATVWYDQVRQFRERRDLMLSNGLQGLVLILAVLALFLPLRLAGWVAAGIPVAFLGAMIALSLAEVSINMMSMFAFIVALGLVVDDAIIIGESVTRQREKGVPPLRAAIAGTCEVAPPVAVAVATTMLFLVPSLFLPTVIGKISLSLGVVVIACLAFSLVESLLILPAHLAHAAKSTDGLRLQGRVDAGLRRFVEGVYRPLLEACLAWPSLVLSAGLVVWLLTAALLAGGWVRSAFLPRVEDDYVTARVVLPAGSPATETEHATAQIEAAARTLEAELPEGRLFDHVMVAIGDSPNRHDDEQGGGEGPNVGHVHLTLASHTQRALSSIDVERLWRERTGAVRGAERVEFRGSDLVGEAEVHVSLSGSDRAQLRRAAESLQARVAGLPGVRGTRHSEQGGKQELRLAVRPEGEARGLTIAELTRQVRQAFHGEEVQRIQRGRDDVSVVVRYPHAERRSLADLEAMRVRLPDGGDAPFASLATVRYGRSAAALTRRDRRSQIGVEIQLDSAVTGATPFADRLSSEVLPGLAKEFPGVAWDFYGASSEEVELSGYLYRAWTLALAAAYALLAVTLRSYTKPLLIVAAIPFGLVGGVLGHALLGLEFSSFSQVGLVALTGVVINDALVLLHRANQSCAEGAPWREALVEAGVTRFRPILLTSLTTFFGLLPLLFEGSAQAAWLVPMAVTLGFGVLFATGVTLLVVPSAALALERLGQKISVSASTGPATRSSRPVQWTS